MRKISIYKSFHQDMVPPLTGYATDKIAGYTIYKIDAGYAKDIKTENFRQKNY